MRRGVIPFFILKKRGEVMSKDIIVKCPICNDIFHTPQKQGDAEGCTKCGDVFIIHKEDVLEGTDLL